MKRVKMIKTIIICILICLCLPGCAKKESIPEPPMEEFYKYVRLLEFESTVVESLDVYLYGAEFYFHLKDTKTFDPKGEDIESFNVVYTMGLTGNTHGFFPLGFDDMKEMQGLYEDFYMAEKNGIHYTFEGEKLKEVERRLNEPREKEE